MSPAGDDFATTMPPPIYTGSPEAVTNSLKHGRAGASRSACLPLPIGFILAISDDGKGFSAAKSARPRKGMGLRIMHYRAGMIGGSLVIQKKPDGGTSVICTVDNPDNVKYENPQKVS